MKSIIETINESINSKMINESAKNVIMAFTHDDPEITYIFINADENKIPDWFDWDSVKNPKNIVGFRHSDEDPEVYSIAASESAMKNDCLKAIADHIKTVDPNDNWIEGFYPTMGGFYEWPNETYNGEKPADIYKKIINNIEQSYIDGDSASVWGIVDISKMETVVCGDTDVIFVDDIDQWLSENE